MHFIKSKSTVVKVLLSELKSFKLNDLEEQRLMFIQNDLKVLLSLDVPKVDLNELHVPTGLF